MRPQSLLQHRHRWTRAWTIALLALGVAATASAGPIHYYGELLTSEAAVGLPGDVRAQLDTMLTGDPADLLLDGSVSAGDGIGSGYVSDGGSVTYTHRFSPSAQVESVVRAALSVVTFDDSLFDAREAVAITLDDAFWAQGGATFQVFGGTVQAAVFDQDGEAVVTVRSLRGDVQVVASLFEVVYTAVDATGGGGTGVGAVPEPGAALLFCAGIGVIGVATRQRA
jgi:hypothetical protein